jgi:hypothetical protein
MLHYLMNRVPSVINSVFSSVIKRNFCNYYPSCKVVVTSVQDKVDNIDKYTTQQFQDFYNPYNDSYYTSWYDHMNFNDAKRILPFDDYVFDNES